MIQKGKAAGGDAGGFCLGLVLGGIEWADIKDDFHFNRKIIFGTMPVSAYRPGDTFDRYLRTAVESHTQVRHVSQRIVKAVPEIGDADHQR